MLNNQMCMPLSVIINCCLSLVGSHRLTRCLLTREEVALAHEWMWIDWMGPRVGSFFFLSMQSGVREGSVCNFQWPTCKFSYLETIYETISFVLWEHNELNDGHLRNGIVCKYRFMIPKFVHRVGLLYLTALN